MTEPEQDAGGRGGRAWLRWVGWAVTAGFAVLGLLLLRDRWDEVQASGGLPGVVPFVAAITINALANGVLVQAWREGIAVGGTRVPLGTAARVWSASQLTRLGFAVAPIGARPLMGRRYGISPAVGAVTTLLEVAWLVALSPVLLLVTLPAWAGDAPAWRWAGVVGVVPAAVMVAVVAWPNRVIDLMRRSIEATPLRRLVGATTLAAAGRIRVTRRTSTRWGALYVLNYGLRIAAYLVMLAAVDADLGVHAARAVGAFALGQFVGNLAVVVPGGIGPREGATALVLGPALGGGTALVVVAATRLAELAAELAFFGGSRLTPRRPGRPEGPGSR
ncbi:MAG TPA: hypothetical protein VGA69_01515 [Nitriliruptorales bacterium]